jgi:hypothetical protein
MLIQHRAGVRSPGTPELVIGALPPAQPLLCQLRRVGDLALVADTDARRGTHSA